MQKNIFNLYKKTFSYNLLAPCCAPGSTQGKTLKGKNIVS